MQKSIIVAMSSNRVIGVKGTLPWHMPADMRHFKDTTQGHPVIMGRKTFESIGRPLPKRTNIILSRQKHLTYPKGCYFCSGLSEAFALAASTGAKEAFVIGGSQLYAEALGTVDNLYITEIHATLTGDTCFPEFSLNEWREVSTEEHKADEQHAYPYTFVRYTRRLS